ncbi:hypothetical protein CCACVL1_22325 [Corchorus capsularis]|uniref:Uncharacterized protein n=1 Tax=Corchorus capsularis TaxID=210143 RepID=A0A1R3H0E9_COCAP|nr:hypothetical protein CCACVL1_22325 [Corchorus capsularis]
MNRPPLGLAPVLASEFDKDSHYSSKGKGRVNFYPAFLIAEPRISGFNAEKVIRRLRFDDHYRVEVRGFERGILVLLRKSIGKVQVFEKAGQFISIIIEENDCFRWALSAIYAKSLMRRGAWDHDWSNYALN